MPGMISFVLANVSAFATCMMTTLYGYTTNMNVFITMLIICIVLYVIHTTLYISNTSFSKIKSLIVCVTSCTGMCVIMIYLVSLIEI